MGTSSSDEEARCQLRELQEDIKGRRDYDDHKHAEIRHDSRREELDIHARIDGLEKQVTSIHEDVLGSIHCEQRAANLRYNSAPSELQRIHEETKRGVEDMAGCIQDKVENRMAEFYSVLRTNRGGSCSGRQARQLLRRGCGSSRSCGSASCAAWSGCVIMYGICPQRHQPRRRVGAHVAGSQGAGHAGRRDCANNR